MATRGRHLSLSAKALLLLAAAFSLIACSGLPPIKPAVPGTADSQLRQCLRAFPGEKLRLIHAIEASMEDGARTTQLGVVLVDPARGSIHSVLMTLEGFVLFDAEDNGGIRINRAVPPFDTMIFAEKLMNDIKLIFLRPSGPMLASGVIPDGPPVCRFRAGRGMTLDIMLPGDTMQEMRLYTEQNELVRKVMAYGLDEKGIPGRIDLTAYGFREYSLQMKLITAEPVTDEKRKSN